jgi:hypothetical protein
MAMSGSIFIAESEIRVEEIAGTVTLRVLRAGSLDNAVTITYGITGDTALAGQDFIGGAGTVAMASGTREVSVPIEIGLLHHHRQGRQPLRTPHLPHLDSR